MAMLIALIRFGRKKTISRWETGYPAPALPSLGARGLEVLKHPSPPRGMGGVRPQRDTDTVNQKRKPLV